MSIPPAPLSSTEAEQFDARERSRIVQAARALYLREGVAQTSAADLARYLRMPEHAVRRWFPTPEPLVEAVVEAHIATMQAELRDFTERFSTAVEELLALRNWISEELRASGSLFFRQLETLYPAAGQRWQAHLAGFPRQHLRQNLQLGMQQGFYRPDLAAAQEVEAWFEQLDALRHFEGTSAEVADWHHAQLTGFLARLVTPAGALVARRLQEAAPYY